MARGYEDTAPGLNRYVRDAMVANHDRWLADCAAVGILGQLIARTRSRARPKVVRRASRVAPEG
jgi:hypothetical protein